MKRHKRLLAFGAALLLVGAIGFIWYSEDPQLRTQRLIRQRLQALAKAACFKEQDPPFVRLGYPGKVTEFFSETVELDITLGPRAAQESVSRPHLRDGITALRASNRGLNVEFIDVVVHFTPPATNAWAHLTSKIYFIGDPDYFVQEFRIDLEKPAADWLIRRVATVRTME